MNTCPDTCVVDTNVPIIANHATNYDENDTISLECIKACLEIIDHISKNGGLVIDDNGEIFEEYARYLSFKGAPGLGDKFMKWVHDYQWYPEKVTRISIQRLNGTYKQFPDHAGLVNFDTNDRKFVAVANAHSINDKPPILQATDTKWWGWKDALSEVGIDVQFLCPDYAEEKYSMKKN